MLKKIHVYDCDGVLVDTSHRYRNLPNGSIDLDYWFANRTAEKMKKDRLLPLTRQYFADCLNPEIYTVICTARKIDVLDIGWIVGYLGAPDKLIMRPENDSSPDGTFKRRELVRLFNLRQFSKLPRYFWEDNVKNIRATFDLWTKAFLVHSNNTETR